MNNIYSGKKLIVLIKERNAKYLFREEMHSAYEGKKCKVLIQGRNE
jgi:hypothetical protein